MPTARGITVTLQSQYDALTIPEQILHPPTAAPPNASISSLNLSNDQDQPLPPPEPSHSPTIDIRIPTYPSSQFWINYICIAPQGYTADINVRFYYFKLFAGGRCILSWGVGEEDDWCGKTMHALFSAGTDFEGKGVVEKRGLFFPRTGRRGGGVGFEIRVFRAKARKRQVVSYESVKVLEVEQLDFDLTNIGRVKRGERQRMYTYALIDPKDEPYVTFRYTIEGGRTSEETTSDITVSPPLSSAGSSIQVKQNDPPPADLRRKLSVPPQTKLVASSTSSEPMSPIKKVAFTDDNVNTSVTDFGEVKPRDWVLRTPSPMVSRLFDHPTTPSPGHRKGISSGMLKNVVTNVLKKREERDG